MNDEHIELPTEIDADLLARARETAAGHPGLEDALRRLDSLDQIDLDHQLVEFDAIHRALRAALAGERQGSEEP